ncbi:hypothetical protein GCG54_00015188 [Colletotrichum gloeosporioides]|uniref:Uncharacterized protein n=1 Tax=Colletotrichum gloeosporioides TaxID=474922 RepID=A0A8H4FH83_COLGL|nr:uncharacterized protein GCG54_00015188 [Colletotrichum gloeosporioides]KAF3801965.1 hypothetical protein GCG54_00015188 [Colletotrichum gloeosporioides]
MPPKAQQKRRLLEETTEPLAGKIIFVPPKNRMTARLKPDLERTGYNHPGVIVSSRPDGVGRVKIAMLTSFKDTPVAYVLDREEDYAHYLPIDDALHPISSIRRLKRRPECPSLRKKSYVYIGEKHTIPYTSLEPYGRSSRYSAGPWLCQGSVRILQSHFGEPLDDDNDDDISCTDTSDGECDLGEGDLGEGKLDGWQIDVELDSVSIGQSNPLPLQLTLVAGPSAASMLGSEGSSSNPPTPKERSLSISRLSSSSLSFSEFPPYCDEYITFHQPQHAVSPSLPTARVDYATKQIQTPPKGLVTNSYLLLIIITIIAFGPRLVGGGCGE